MPLRALLEIAGVCAVCVVSARAETEGERPRVDWSSLIDSRAFVGREPSPPTVGLHSQIRYTANHRDSDTDAFTHGIGLPRTKATISGGTIEGGPRYQVIFAAGTSGEVLVEAAFITQSLGDGFGLRVGQAKLPFYIERNTSAKHLLTVDRSRVSAVFDQGFSQFVELNHESDRWRSAIALSDGLKTNDTDFFNMKEADLAITGRLEHRVGEATWKQLADQTSFPGDPFGAQIGVAAHAQWGGDTGIATKDTDILSATLDAGVGGDGWSVLVAAVWRRADSAGMPSYDDYGLLAQGSVFLDRHNEVFGRIDSVIPDSDRASGDPFTTLTAGVNHYLVERSHAVTITLDVQYLLDDLAGSASLVGQSSSLGQLADLEEGQLVFRLQIEFVL
ncbi:MAG: hypothetical protein H6811_08915 [Phycisphaeraceae bacterium]|nr:hypothetical protein [Phycisphaeraceae bacterium]